MRALFLLLLLLNLAYFSWQYTRETPEIVTDMPALIDAQPIVLLSEVKAREAEVKEAEAGLIESRRLESEALAGHVVSAELSDAIKKPVSKKIAPSKTKEIVKTAAIIAKKEAILPVVGECFTVGPFRDLEKLRSLTRAIKSYVVEADFRGKEEKSAPLYWVYTPAEKNKKLIEKTASRLRAKKIKDFYILRRGDKANSISLGRFKNKQGMQRFVKKLEKLGFNVLVEVVRKNVTIYWLDYRLAEGKSIPESVFLKYKPSNKQAASRLKRECSS